MKVFLWLVVMALAVFYSGCWCFAFLVMQYIRDFRGTSYLPNLTHIVLVPYSWILFCPLPWFVAAVALSIRRDPSQKVVLIFTGTAILTVAIIFWAVALAAFLGTVPYKV